MNYRAMIISTLFFALISPLSAQETPALPAAQGRNPIIWADVPDTSVLRVGDTYYMSSTTMHMVPGLPIMYSKDLINWKLASYAHYSLGDTVGLNLNNGRSEYGNGSWASSLRFYKGKFYVSTFAISTGKTHIYSTDAPFSGKWEEKSFSPMLHDSSLFFDDDGRVYMIYAANNIRIVELKEDLTGIKPGGIDKEIIHQIGRAAGGQIGLGGEGSQMFKVNGKYYLFNITWPRNDMRTELVSRADSITGPYETRVCMKDRGIAQGGIFDSPDGKWYAVLFRDSGAVGRIPYLMPVEWSDGWPVLGVDGKVPQTLDIPVANDPIPAIVASDDFESSSLNPVWQWNHNPVEKDWSLTARPGFMRITTGRIDKNILDAKNMLTQRTFGPACSAVIKLDVSGMKDGDCAGLCALQKTYGYIAALKSGEEKSIAVFSKPDGVHQQATEFIPLNQNTVWFKISCDFQDQKDVARFYYSLNGTDWISLGEELHMVYTLPHFMGYRFGLFNFATKSAGGTVDFDSYKISRDK